MEYKIQVAQDHPDKFNSFDAIECQKNYIFVTYIKRYINKKEHKV